MRPAQHRGPGRATRRALALATALSLVGGAHGAPDNPPPRAIEQALTVAALEKKGITLYVNGQAIGGAVTKLEAGVSVELRNPQYGRIVVRLDRIDAIAMP